jgi:hypothetical protein
MNILNLIVGFFMVGLGFLVKSFPNLIAGYNTMPKDKKKNVDIESLSTFMRNGLIVIGFTIIIGYYFFKWIGFDLIANQIIPIVTLGGVIFMVLKAQKFDHNEDKKTKMTYIILGLIIAFVIGLISYGFIPSKLIFNNSTIQFTGMYGFEINYSDINDVALVDNIPVIKMRTNGFSFGTVRKGFFNLDKYGKTRLLIHSKNSPYLIISKKSGERTIINFKNKAETEDIYKKIKSITDK